MSSMKFDTETESKCQLNKHENPTEDECDFVTHLDDGITVKLLLMKNCLQIIKSPALVTELFADISAKARVSY